MRLTKKYGIIFTRFSGNGNDEITVVLSGSVANPSFYNTLTKLTPEVNILVLIACVSF